MGRGRRGGVLAPALFAALVALSVIVRIGVLLNRSLDPDESQHLHSAWRVGQGQVPYRDFWEHHLPLLYYGLAPVTRWLAEGPAVYLAGRVLMTIVAGVALVLTYRLARRLSHDAAPVAVILLALLPQFVENSTEVRPDVPALVAWLFALLAVLTWRERGTCGWLWVAGLAQGVALAFTPKAVYGALGLALVVVMAGGGEESAGLARASGRLVRLAVGAGIPLSGLLAWLGLTGGPAALAAFWDQAVLQNLRFADFMKTWPVAPDGAGFLVLALIGVAVATRCHGVSVLRHPVHGVLLPPVVVIGVLLALPGTPAVYRQAWLPTLPILAAYAATVLVAAFSWARAGRAGGRAVVAVLAVAAGLVVPAGASIYDALRDHTERSFRVMRLLLRETCPGEPVLDGTALFVFRPSAYRYGVLMTGVREWIARGVIPEEQIEEDLRRTRARVVYPDWRVRALIGPVADFLARHYVESDDGLLVAGAAIPVSGGPQGGRAYVDLLVSGRYRFTAGPGIEVAVDRVGRRRGWVDLGEGRHEVTWIGPAGVIRFLALTCPERRSLAARVRSEAHGSRPDQIA